MMAFIFAIGLFGQSVLAASPPVGPEILAAKIKHGKLVIRTYQYDCNTLSGTLTEIPQMEKALGMPKRFALGFASTKMKCPNETPRREVEVEIALPQAAVGDDVEIWSGQAHVGYKVKRPQPNQELGVVVPPSTVTPPQPGGANK